MLRVTGLSKRLKIISNTNEPKKFYLESDREDFEEYVFSGMGELKIIEIISLSADFNPKFNKIYYYSESRGKKIVTSNMGARYNGGLLLETFRAGIFLKDVDMFNVSYKGKSNYLKKRKKRTFDKHLDRIKGIRLEEISVGDAVNGMEYIIRGVKNSY